jgi:hypothetical protein
MSNIAQKEHRLSDLDVRHPHMITVNVAQQVMKVVQQTVVKHGHNIEVIHETLIPSNPHKLGFYRVILTTGANKDSYLFDTQMLLDMRVEWETFVTAKVTDMMEKIV